VARDRRSAPRQVTPARFATFTFAALAAQVLIVMSGAAVRLTGSGLGCSDWPRCEEDRFVAPLEFHPMIEFVNRLVSFVVVATVVLVIWGALRRVPYRRDLLDLGWWIAAITAVQVVLGAITVRTHLWPPVVMAHFLLSMVLIAIAVVLHHRASTDTPDAVPPTPLHDTTSGRLTTPLLVAVSAVLFTGTVVTGSGPHGGDENVERLGFYVPTVTRWHTGAVFLFLGLLLVTLLALRSAPGATRVMRAGSLVLGVTLVQGAIGYYQYFNGVPELAVYLHVLGSMGVLGTAVWFVLEHRFAEGSQRDLSPAHLAHDEALG
jgi:heme a synthase